MTPSKHIGLAVSEIVNFWAKQAGFAQVGAFLAAFGQVIKLDFEFALGERSSEQVVRVLKAWGVSSHTAQLFVSERMTATA